MSAWTSRRSLNRSRMASTTTSRTSAVLPPACRWSEATSAICSRSPAVHALGHPHERILDRHAELLVRHGPAQLALGRLLGLVQDRRQPTDEAVSGPQRRGEHGEVVGELVFERPATPIQLRLVRSADEQGRHQREQGEHRRDQAEQCQPDARGCGQGDEREGRIGNSPISSSSLKRSHQGVRWNARSAVRSTWPSRRSRTLSEAGSFPDMVPEAGTNSPDPGPHRASSRSQDRAHREPRERRGEERQERRGHRRRDEPIEERAVERRNRVRDRRVT